jgi:hypothetical protein
MPATFNPESVIPRRLDALPCSVLAFATIYGKRSQSYLAQAFRGNRQLPGNEAQEMLALLDELEALRDDFPQIPIDFSNGLGIRRALEARRDGATDVTLVCTLSELRAAL